MDNNKRSFEGAKEGRRSNARLFFLDILMRILRGKETGLIIAVLIVVIALSILSPYFLSVTNILNVLRGISVIGIIAVGSALVLISGGIDLSIGSVLALGAMLMARLMTIYHWNPWLALFGGLCIGVAVGAFNGIMVTRVKVNAFITTLGMLSIARGLTYLLSVGSNIDVGDPGVRFLGSGYISIVPMPVIQLLIIVIIGHVLLNYTILGRRILLVGGDETSAMLSGIRVDNIRLFAFTLCVGLSAYAGIVNSGNLGTASTASGQSALLDVIAAVIIGGTSLAGGEGSIVGAILGAILIGLLRNAFVLLGVSMHFQTVSLGVVIILAVVLDIYRKKRRV